MFTQWKSCSVLVRICAHKIYSGLHFNIYGQEFYTSHPQAAENCMCLLLIFHIKLMGILQSYTWRSAVKFKSRSRSKSLNQKKTQKPTILPILCSLTCLCASSLKQWHVMCVILSLEAGWEGSIFNLFFYFRHLAVFHRASQKKNLHDVVWIIRRTSLQILVGIASAIRPM